MSPPSKADLFHALASMPSPNEVEPLNKVTLSRGALIRRITQFNDSIHADLDEVDKLQDLRDDAFSRYRSARERLYQCPSEDAFDDFLLCAARLTRLNSDISKLLERIQV